MFTSFDLNKSTLTLFAWKGKWYFDFNNFCNAIGLNVHRDSLQDSLQDYDHSLRTTPRQKTWHLSLDLNAIKEDMNKSNRCRLERGIVVNENMETFLKVISEPFLAVEFVFFCEYLQTMYQKWDAKKQSMTASEFRNHLSKRCPFWLYIIDHMQILEPIIEQYNNAPKPPQNDSVQETDDLLNYLQLFRMTNTKEKDDEEKGEEKGEVVSVVKFEPKTVQVFRITKENVKKKEREEKALSIVKFEPKTVDKPMGKKRKRSVSTRDRIAIAADQNWECFYCLELLDECFEVDHIERFCESGNDHHSNLWAICASCHAKKDEWDRKRKKSNIWSDYRKLSDEEKKQRRQEILQKIQAL